MNSKWDGIEELSHIEYVDKKEMEEIIDRVRGGGEAEKAGEDMGTDIEDMGTDIEDMGTDIEHCEQCGRHKGWGYRQVDRAKMRAQARQIKRLNYIVRTLVDSMI